MRKIVGNTVATTVKKPDWLVDDPKNGGYIANKDAIGSTVFIGTIQTSLQDFGVEAGKGKLCIMKHKVDAESGLVYFFVDVPSGDAAPSPDPIKCCGVGEDGNVYIGVYDFLKGWTFERKEIANGAASGSGAFIGTTDTPFVDYQAEYEAGKICFVSYSLGVEFGDVLCLVNFVTGSQYLGRVIRCTGVGNDGLIYKGVYSDNEWTFSTNTEEPATFTAKYGVTTCDEVRKAYAAGTAVFAEKDSYRFPLTYLAVSGFLFSGYYNGNNITYSLDHNDVWSEEVTAPTKDVFMVNLSSTGSGYRADKTYAEIKTAFSLKEKPILAQYSGKLYICTGYDPAGYYFHEIVSADSRGGNIGAFIVSSADSWGHITSSIPFSTTTIGNSSSDNKLPTAKAVYDHVNAKANEITAATDEKLEEKAEVFYAKYGVTTIAEVKAAVDAGKIVYVRVSVDSRDQLLPLMGADTDYSDLTFADFTFGGIVYRKLCFYKVTANGWFDQSIKIARFITESRDDNTLVTTHGIATYFEENNNIFVVRGTRTGSVDTFDKTYAEIKAAREAGKLVILRSPTGGLYYLYKPGEAFITGEYDDSYTFMPVEYSQQNFTLSGYKVSSSDVWEVIYPVIPPYATTLINGRIESTRVPTAKAVYDHITERLAEAKDVFVAEYGVTTHAEIYEASQAGKVCFCCYNGVSWLPLRSSVNEPGATRFCGYLGNRLCTWKVSLDNEWSESYVATSDAITAESADDSFPTSKAVYDFVTEKLEAIETGSGGGLVVTVTATTSGDPGSQSTTYSLDATYEDIKAAVDANQLVVLRRNVSRYGYQYYLFNSYQPNSVDFRSVLDLNGTYERIGVYSDGSVTYSTYDNPIPSSVATKEYVDTMLGVIENGSY